MLFNTYLAFSANICIGFPDHFQWRIRCEIILQLVLNSVNDSSVEAHQGKLGVHHIAGSEGVDLPAISGNKWVINALNRLKINDNEKLKIEIILWKLEPYIKNNNSKTNFKAVQTLERQIPQRLRQ